MMTSSTSGQQERIAVTMYVDFLKKLEKGPKVVLTSMSAELDTDFIGTLCSKVDFNGFIYGVFENEDSVLVTSIDGAACAFEEEITYSVRFSWGETDSTRTHFLNIQEKHNHGR